MDMQVVKTKMPVGTKKGKEQYTLKRVSYPHVTSAAIAGEVSKSSSFSTADARAILSAFVDVITDELLNGHIVEMDVLGTLRPKISAKTTETREECTVAMIRKVGIQYIAGQELAKEAKKIPMRVIDIYADGSETDTDIDGDDDEQENGGGSTPGGGGDLVG